MKKQTLFAGLVLLVMISFGQTIEITPTYSHQWGGRWRGIDGTDLKIGNGGAYGINLDVTLPTNPVTITFIWSRLDSYLDIDRFNEPTERLFDMTTEYFLLGYTRQQKVSDVFTPFVTAALGVANFAPQDSEYNNQSKFAGSLGAGFKLYPSRKIGLRAHIRMMIPFQGASAGIFCGTGGCGTSVGAGSSDMQGDVGGGLIFRLGDTE
jgi:hypothetical protein